MIHCRACGTANEDESRFCDECGERLTPLRTQSDTVPAWVSEIESTLKTQDDDGGAQDELEVPAWFRDLQASQPHRLMEEASQLEHGGKETAPEWLAALQRAQAELEALRESAEAEPMQLEDESVQTDAKTTQAEPQAVHTKGEPLQTGTESGETEPTQLLPQSRAAGSESPEWLREFHAMGAEPEPEPTTPKKGDAGLQVPARPVEARLAGGDGEPEALVPEGNATEQLPEWLGQPPPAAQQSREDGDLKDSQDSDRLLALKLRTLRDEELKPQDGVIALEESSDAGELLKDLPETLPARASIVQGLGAPLPERETAISDRFASQARLFSEIVAHPSQVAPIATAQPESSSLSRLIRYAIYVVLIAVAVGAMLAIIFNSRFSLLFGQIESILDNLGGLIGG